MRRLFIAGSFLVFVAACHGGGPEVLRVPELPDAAAVSLDASGEASATDLEDGAAPGEPLTLARLVPSSGPFEGGNRAVVRGSGFGKGTVVFVGSHAVEPSDTGLIDSHRLSLVLPPGEPGPTDVRVERGEREATLLDGYTYNALAVDPPSGSTAGGTPVEIRGSGTSFVQGVDVRFGGESCADVEVLSPTRVTCRTPPGDVGSVDVEAIAPVSGEPPVVGTDAYAFVDLAQTLRGGLSGGPIQGTLNVTVVDSVRETRLPGAFVMVGDDLDTPYQGFTDARGQITLSGSDLEGPVTVHVAMECFEKGSIVAFDSVNVTVFLRSQYGVDPACKDIPDDFEISEVQGGHGREAAVISGEVIFPGSDEEFFYNDWSVVPPPRPGEVRAAYIYTTRPSTSSGRVSTKTSGGINRIVEEASTPGRVGYPFRIAARPGSLAVYALAGIEHLETGRFAPYSMGIARDLVTAPGAEVEGVDIFVQIPLDRELVVSLADIPAGTPQGPDEFRVEAHLQLGGEGVMAREEDRGLLDLVVRPDSGSLFRFFGQPLLSGPLADGRYEVLAGWYSGQDEDPPHTVVLRKGVAQSNEPMVVDDWLGIPVATRPAHGGRVPEDRVLQWEADGVQPDLHVVSIVGGDGVPAWRQIVPGSRYHIAIPDLSSLPALEDIAEGFVTWKVWAVKIDGFHFDAFHYGLLLRREWTHAAHNSFVMRR